MSTTGTINTTEELNDIRQQSQESLKLVKGPDFTVDLSEWMTIKRYAEKYGVTTQVISNWIARGIIPSDCIKDFPELNNIRIIKDQVYK